VHGEPPYTHTANDADPPVSHRPSAHLRRDAKKGL
jgi:hypothetical protein